MNRYLAVNIEGKIEQPTVIRTSSFNNVENVDCNIKSLESFILKMDIKIFYD